MGRECVTNEEEKEGIKGFCVKARRKDITTKTQA
jgi:hypothetical protein